MSQLKHKIFTAVPELVCMNWKSDTVASWDFMIYDGDDDIIVNMDKILPLLYGIYKKIMWFCHRYPIWDNLMLPNLWAGILILQRKWKNYQVGGLTIWGVPRETWIFHSGSLNGWHKVEDLLCCKLILYGMLWGLWYKFRYRKDHALTGLY